MKLLLDTHTFVWRLLDDPRLPQSTNDLIDDMSNQIFLSSVSGFEIATKFSVGKLKLPTDAANFIRIGIEENQIVELPLVMRHTVGVANLPLIHRDPFDRLLVSVALDEDMTLLTDDAEIRKYALKLAW